MRNFNVDDEQTIRLRNDSLMLQTGKRKVHKTSIHLLDVSEQLYSQEALQRPRLMQTVCDFGGERQNSKMKNSFALGVSCTHARFLVGVKDRCLVTVRMLFVSSTGQVFITPILRNNRAIPTNAERGSQTIPLHRIR